MPLAADDVLVLAQGPDRSGLAWAFIMAGVVILGFYWWLLGVYRRDAIAAQEERNTLQGPSPR